MQLERHARSLRHDAVAIYCGARPCHRSPASSRSRRPRAARAVRLPPAGGACGRAGRDAARACRSRGASCSASSSSWRERVGGAAGAPRRAARALEPAIPAELVELARWIARRVLLDVLARAAARAAARSGARGPRPRVRVRHGARRGDQRQPVAPRLTDGAPALDGERQRAVLDAAGGRGPADGDCERAPTTASLRRLADRGLLALEPRAQRRRPLVDAVGARSAHAPPLTAEQRAALEPILAALAERDDSVSDPDASSVPGSAASCCTASPARARRRSTCGRPRPR